MRMITDYVLIFDGGSLGNPGKGYGSFSIRTYDGGRSGLHRRHFGDNRTSNEAEYLALIAGLDYLLREIESQGENSQETTLEVRGDSALVVHQVEGLWRTKKEHLIPLRDKVRELAGKFERVDFLWQSREASVEVLGH